MRFSTLCAVPMAVLALLLIGSSAATSVPLHHYPVYGGQAIRFAAAAAVLLVIARFTKPPTGHMTRSQWWWFLGLAGFGIAGFNVCLVEATKHADPAVVGTVIAATPVALAILGAFQNGCRPRRQIVLGAGVVAVGTAVISGFGAISTLGMAYSFGALTCEVAFSLCAVPLLPRWGPVRTSAYAAAGAVPILLALGVATDGGAALRVPTAPEAWALAHKAFAVAILANLLWYAALTSIRAERAGLFYGFVPLGSLATGALLGQDRPGFSTVAGTAFVLAGLMVGMWRVPSRSRTVPSNEVVMAARSAAPALPLSRSRW